MTGEICGVSFLLIRNYAARSRKAVRQVKDCCNLGLVAVLENPGDVTVQGEHLVHQKYIATHEKSY